MLGVRFGKLLVVAREANQPDGTAVWRCVCDCGETRRVAGTGLRAGRHKSCGCASPRFTSEYLTTHGLTATRTYRIWQGMKARCSDAAQGKARKLYFEKGIRVCERWQDFRTFLADMGEAPYGMSIDRIDGNWHYEPGNCRWATSKQQANNTSANRLITNNGQTMTLSAWAEKCGVKANTLLYRLQRGVPVERALEVSIVHAGRLRALTRLRCCEVCGREFLPRTSQVAQGRGRFCSQPCNGKARIKRIQKPELTIERLQGD